MLPFSLKNILSNSLFLLSISSLFIWTSCSTEGIQSEEAETIDQTEVAYIHFYMIDNYVKVYVDDKLVEETKAVNRHDYTERDISLSEYVDKGQHTIKVELYNGEGILIDDPHDKVWEIFYEILVEGEAVDYIHEKENSDELGLVWSREHEITVE